MASAGSVPDDGTIPGAMPERWETAVEDFAQVIALGLDRAQDLADVIAEVNRTRPGLTKAVAAALGGAIVGAVIAGRFARRRPTARERARQAAGAVRRAAGERVSALEQAAAVAQAAAQRLAERAPSPSDIRDRLPRVDRSDVADRASGLRNRASEMGQRARRGMSGPNLGVSQLPNAAKLVPIAVALLKNPLVRSLLMGAVVRMARRRR